MNHFRAHRPTFMGDVWQQFEEILARSVRSDAGDRGLDEFGFRPAEQAQRDLGGSGSPNL